MTLATQFVPWNSLEPEAKGPRSSFVGILVTTVLSAGDKDVFCWDVFQLSTSQVLQRVEDSPKVIRVRHTSYLA